MQSEFRPSRITLQHKLTLAHLAVILLSTLIAEIVTLVGMALILGQAVFTPLGWGLHVILVLTGTGIIGGITGASINYLLARRLHRVLEVSRAWMRGNLSLRIADSRRDEIGLLAHQLNLLAEHLEEDEEDLGELQERTSRLSDQVRALAVVEERNRLARELHDSVKQNLFSVAMTASAIRARIDALDSIPADLKEMVLEVETTSRAAQQEMTRLIADLRPESIYAQGLAETLNDFTLLLGAREHLLIYLDVHGNDKLLPPAVAEVLYRVAQEALHNVARHACATRVDVDLRCIPEQVSLTIEDNGVGFDPSEAHKGLGLGHMRERIMEVGGVLSVDSQPGIGTTIVAEVALTHPLGLRPDQAEMEESRPMPTIENWAWLGQKLTIPVGQVWPWLPADQVNLRHPIVEATDGSTLLVRHSSSLLGLLRSYSIQVGQKAPLARIHCGRTGYEWEMMGASWALRRIRGVSGRMVLTRNGQPMAAMQPQGRMLHTWNEIVYDGRGYRLSYVKDKPGGYILVDEANDTLLVAEGSNPDQFGLCRALPLPLLVMVTMRIADEVIVEKDKTTSEQK
ncbi:MAG: histidine kinase [Anaerolineae bacterium]|jgi:NarL family two-component system sensor histidine kinase LiaS